MCALCVFIRYKPALGQLAGQQYMAFGFLYHYNAWRGKANQTPHTCSYIHCIIPTFSLWNEPNKKRFSEHRRSIKTVGTAKSTKLLFFGFRIRHRKLRLEPTVHKYYSSASCLRIRRRQQALYMSRCSLALDAKTQDHKHLPLFLSLDSLYGRAPTSFALIHCTCAPPAGIQHGALVKGPVIEPHLRRHISR